MSQPIIQVESLGKKYLIDQQRGGRGRYQTLRDTLAGWGRSLGRRLRRPFGGDGTRKQEEFWALQDVSFDVQPGEVLGVIGRNGAGKSTLLKVLSRITEPTNGRVTLRGRVASLLEVGTGFHPELSGRENIYLNGAILGMTRAEIRRKFDEIVDFAEVAKFLDTPVKRYSSGMYMKLAFAVAAHLEPEILVVDEVLAVGDTSFQKKCLGKMNEVARKEGRTVLFVSHNMAAIQALCTRAAWLKAGRLEQIGPVEEQVAAYQADSDPNPRKTQGPKELGPGVVLERFEFSPSPVEAGDSLGFTLEVSSRRRCPVEHLCLLFYSSVGFRVAILDLRREEPYYLDPESPLRIDGRIPTFNLVEGDYSVGLFIVAGEVDGDFFDLAEVSVSPPPAVPSVVPYLKCHRGSVELRCTLEAGARAEPCWGG